MKAEQPILLMDGFEYLISNNSFEAFLKFLQTVRGRVQNHNAIVIAPLMEKVLEPRELGLIEIETTTLEPQP
jgi:archaellum biogenesis ATPase FlaH